jgi:plasmid stability protein
MNIQFVRLEDDICEELNVQALEQRRTVSDLVNEILRAHMARERESDGSMSN